MEALTKKFCGTVGVGVGVDGVPEANSGGKGGKKLAETGIDVGVPAVVRVTNGGGNSDCVVVGLVWRKGLT